jgi:hypothetical protein
MEDRPDREPRVYFENLSPEYAHLCFWVADALETSFENGVFSSFRAQGSEWSLGGS